MTVSVMTRWRGLSRPRPDFLHQCRRSSTISIFAILDF
ncbi:hypothetical protein CDS [Bradyrhizobium sp.]|nr:hypothetical protein CDS [Bradyrhizobium sp.]